MTALDVLRNVSKHDDMDPNLIEHLSQQTSGIEKPKMAQIIQTLAEIGVNLSGNINELDWMGRMTLLEENCKRIPTREYLWKLIQSFELMIEQGSSFDI